MVQTLKEFGGKPLSKLDEEKVEVVKGPQEPLSADLYLIRIRRNRTLIYLPPKSLKACEATEGDHIRKFIRRMVTNRNKVVRWLGRVTRVAHHYYIRLEDKIDPIERMIKAMNGPDQLEVWHSPSTNPASLFRALLRRQKIKHLAWLCVDASISLVVVMLAPVLVPIPGPNVFFYYPALRLASHYRAMTGASRALGRMAFTFNVLPELGDLEETLSVAKNDSDISRLTETIGVDGLSSFIERMY